MLGHGAGGGVAAPDLIAAAETAFAIDITVALIEQPHRVAGRRSPLPAPRLDAAWTALLETLADHELVGLTLIAGSSSSRTRVACRAAAAAAAGRSGVLCLAFTLQPAARAGATPRPSRLPELEALAVPVLVVQGERDPFGMPRDTSRRTVERVAGDHGLKADIAAQREALGSWLRAIISAAGRNSTVSPSSDERGGQ